MALLEVKNLGISFGGLRAVDQFEINIKKGQLYGLIGPNGAGKTTIFNMLTGVYKPTDGIIKLDGEDLVGKKTIEINKAGIARTFQNIRLFSQQSVLDNVKIGLHNQYKYSTLTGILRLPKYRKMERKMNEKAMELLKVFELDDKNQPIKDSSTVAIVNGMEYFTSYTTTKNGATESNSATNGDTVTVTNQSRVNKLPSTGSCGVLIYRLAGVILILFAGVLMLMKYKETKTRN